MIASGGCSALSLYNLLTNVRFLLFDVNLHQIELVKKKIKNLS